MRDPNLSDELVKKQLSWSALDFIERSSSRVLGLAIMSLVVAGLLFFLFALIFKIEMKVDAGGQINSAAGVKEINSTIDGIVEVIEVQEGQIVRKNQVIARLKIQGSSDDELGLIEKQLRGLKKSLNGNLKTTALQSRASDAELRSLLIDVSNKLGAVKYKKTQGRELLDKEIAPLKKHLGQLTRQITAIDKSRDRKYLLAQRSALDEDRLRLNSQIANLQSTYNLSMQSATSDAEQTLNGALAKVELLQGSHQIRAPIDGNLVKVLVSSGSSVRSQTAIAYLIPEDAPMIAEVYVKPHDLSRVKVGAQTRFSVDAYPWSRYGHFKGEVASVQRLMTSSNDVNPQTGYLVKIKIDGPTLKRSKEAVAAEPMTLIPGMKVDAKIVWKKGNFFYLAKEQFFGDRL